MSIVKSVSYRALDLATIWMLIYGSQNFQAFAIWLVGIMTVCLWFSAFSEISLDKAKTLVDDSLALRVFAAAINLAYIYALVVSDCPALAAFYCIGTVFLYLEAREVIDLAKKEAA